MTTIVTVCGEGCSVEAVKGSFKARDALFSTRAVYASDLTSSTDAVQQVELILKTAAAERLASVTLRRGCSFFVERGNRLIFRESIFNITGPPPELGDHVVIFDGSRSIIGWGIFNPDSVYRVRMMQSLRECRDDPSSVLNLQHLFESRLEAAGKLRRGLGLPSSLTDAYRWINGDGDRLSGLIIDRFSDVAVVHSGACWIELNREAIVRTLLSYSGISTVIWRLRPVVKNEEGMTKAKECIYPNDTGLDMKSEIRIMEEGVHYWMHLSGQKTGFYTDQRSNRQFLRHISIGQRVLDLCCYTGGFSINAGLGGAEAVLGIDSSRPVIDLARRNAELNGISDVCSFECGDILHRLQVAIENGDRWDVVILDPPKLAFARTHLNKALGRYRKLNRAAMKVVSEGGFLMTCSCSGSIDSTRFVQTVWEAAEQIGKRLTVIRLSGAAADHVYDLNHPEGNYLKCLVVRVE